MAIEVIDTPPDDGKTIEGVVDDKKLPDEALPISKLPAGKQFDVLSKQLRADADHSAEWRKNARVWFGFRAGDHWTDEDKALLDSQDRPHIVFDRVIGVLKAIAGMEINGRHEIAFKPRNTEDTKPNEVLSAASKWMADNCDGEDEESQAFDQCATTGMGWCENRLSYLKDPAGLYIEEMTDCREMYWDRTAKKKNLADARRMARVRRMAYGDAARMFPGKTIDKLDAVWAADMSFNSEAKDQQQKWRRDENSSSQLYDDRCEVTIVQMQWIEIETYWIVADVQTNSKAELSDAQYQVFSRRMAMLGMEVHAARMEREVYKQAFLGGSDTMLKPAGPAPIAGQFTWKCITGEYDAVNGTWFGLVKIMRDPQMWSNKFISQILHIVNTTAKGGILAERCAFDDERDAEDSYAQADRITWMADGALSGAGGPKLIPKPGAGSVETLVGMLAFATSAVPQVIGINLELLGQQDVNQPGILEAMRKQAGMTVLATLFDALRRFRKQTGRARLYFIQNFLSDGRLIRVVGPDSEVAVRLAKDKTVGEYDVVVDDTPTSPNQKEANWAIIQPLIAIFKEQLMANPRVFAMLLEYSPLPSRIVDAIKGFVKEAEDDPQAKQDAELAKKLAVDLQVSEISKNQSVAELNNSKAGATQATAMYDIAMARNLLAKNDLDGLANHLKLMETAQNADKTAADVAKTHSEIAHTDAKTARERVGAHTDVVKAGTDRLSALAKARHDGLSAAIDHLSGVAGAHRDVAAAHKDLAVADHTRRKPVTNGAGTGP